MAGLPVDADTICFYPHPKGHAIVRWHERHDRKTGTTTRKRIMPYRYKRKQARWVQGAPKGPRVLYHANEFDPARVTLVVEGEKCAEYAGKALGDTYNVVTWAGGTNADHLTDWSLLESREVIVCPDADGPGHKAALRIVERLSYTGAVSLVDSGTDGTDIADWIDLNTLGQRFKVVDPDQWWEELLPVDQYPEPPPAILHRTDGVPVVPGHGFIEVIGPMGSGKTWVGLLVVVQALALGRPVVYLRGEMQRRSLQLRLHTLGVDPEVLLNPNRFRSVPVDRLEQFLKLHGNWASGGVIVYDPAAATGPGATSNNATEGLGWLRQVIEPFVGEEDGTLVVSVDHVSKYLPEDVVSLASRGSTAKSARADLVLFVPGYRKVGKHPVPTCWSRDRDGYTNVHIAKGDRLEGVIDTDHPTKLLASIQGRHTDGTLTLTVEPPNDDPTDTEGHRITDDEIMQTMLAVISSNPGQGVRQVVERCAEYHGLPKTRTEQALSRAKQMGWVEVTRSGQTHEHAITDTGEAEIVRLSSVS